MAIAVAMSISSMQAPASAQVSQDQIVAFNQQHRSFGPPYGMVWAHQVPSRPSPYGGMGVKGQVRTFEAAKADGIDGIAFDCFGNASLIENSLKAADQAGMIVAPCIDLSVKMTRDSGDSLVQDETKVIVNYCRLASSYSSAAKTRDGRYIVWEYGAWALSPDQHGQALSAARSQGAKFYIVGGLGRSGDASEDPVTSLTHYAPIWDASYPFLPLDDSAKPGIKTKFVQEIQKPLIASVMPQYTRPGMKLNLPPDGGARYEKMWKEAIADHAAAVIIVTLNDDKDGTNIMPNYEQQTKQFAQEYKSAIAGN
jgi:hypothetical protein